MAVEVAMKEAIEFRGRSVGSRLQPPRLTENEKRIKANAYNNIGAQEYQSPGKWIGEV